MATNIRPNFGDFFGEGKLPELEAVILAKAESYQSMIPILFNVVDTDKDIWQSTTLSGLRNPQKKPESSAIRFQTLQPGFRQTYVIDTWSTGYRISKEMVDDGKYNFIQRATESFSKGQFEVKEISAAQLFTDGFTDTAASADGVSLFSTSHPLENGAGAVLSNRPEDPSELSYTSFKELRNIIQDTVNENGQLARYLPSWLITGQDLQDTAMELVKTQYSPEDANNAVNTVYGTVNLLPAGYWPYLDSDTNFFMMTEVNENGLYFINRKPLEADSDYDKKTQSYELTATSRWTLGYSTPRGLAGNPGA